MHEHPVDIRPDGLETGSDRLLSCRAPRHDRDEIAPITGHRPRLGERVAHPVCGSDDDHLGRRRGEDSEESVAEHRVRVETDERLWPTGTEALA